MIHQHGIEEPEEETFFLKQSFYCFSRIHLSPELPKGLQTLRGDQFTHKIDPGPNSSQDEQVHEQNFYKIMVLGLHPHAQNS